MIRNLAARRTKRRRTRAPLPKMPRATLHYFDGRGHGERVRYALAAADIDFEENFLRAPGDVDAVRSRCLFGQVPLLEIDGQRVVQSWAIVRFLGARFGPRADGDAAWRADAAAEQVRDYFVAGGLVGFGWSEDREGALQTVRDAAARYLPSFEAALAETGFVAGTASASWADYQLLYGLDYTAELLGDAALAAFPRAAALRARLRAEPRMAAFYASAAKPLVTQRYIAEVRAAQLPK